MSWLEEAKLLPLGHKARSDCPQCGAGTNTNAAVINHSHKSYSLYCHACGYNPFEIKGDLSIKELKELRELNDRAKHLERNSSGSVQLPNDYTTDIPIEGRLWLYKAGLSETDIRRYRIGYSEYYGRVVLPVFDSKGSLIWYQCRAIFEGQKPKYLQPKRDRSYIYFCSHKDWTISKHVIFVEDILSAIKVGKVHATAVSLLGTKISDALSGLFSEAEKCTTWLDSDRAGQQGARNIRKRLSLVTEVDNIVTEKDPKLLSTEEIREILCQQ